MKEVRSITNYILAGLAVLLGMLFQGGFFAYGYITLMVIAFAAIAVNRSFRFDLTFFLLLIIPVAALFGCLRTGWKWQALNEVLKYCLLPVVYLWGINMKAEDTRLMKIIFAAILAVTFIGLCAYQGSIYISGAVIEKSNRLQSTIQNANVNAVLILIGIMTGVDLTLKERRIIYILPLIVMIYAFLACKSRYAFVLMCLMAVAYPVISGLKHRYIISLAVIAAIIVAVLLLRGERITQISLTQGTLTERFVSIQDTLSYLTSDPVRFIFGLGPGQWQDEMYVFRSVDYEMRYVHCFPVQLWCDGGLVSVIAFLSALGICLVREIRRHLTLYLYFMMAALIFAHGLLDVDYSFGVVILLFALAVARMNARENMRADNGV